MEKNTIITAEQIIAELEDTVWRMRFIARAIPAKTKKEQRAKESEIYGFECAIEVAKNRLAQLQKAQEAQNV